ncbi:MAG: helix-turn-helix domain-containing protein [Gemmataceae bacterium]
MKLTIRQAAKSVGVSESLLYQCCQERRLRHYRLGGHAKRGKILVDESDLARFLEECCIEPGTLDDGDLKHIH